MEEVLRNKSASTKLYAGLFVAFMNGSSSDLIKQIHAARKYSLNGLIIFDYAHLKEEYIQTLTESVFRTTRRDVIITESQHSSRIPSVESVNKGKKNGRRRK